MRRGLVLGAGGVLGFAWTVGALRALEAERGFDPRTADVLVGTSAGSVTAALLGIGVGVEVMLRHQTGTPAPDDPVIGFDYASGTGGSLPPWPALRPGSPRLLGYALRHPGAVTGMAALAAALPTGRGSLRPVGRLVGDLLAVAGGDGAGWVAHPATWIVAMDYGTGRRVAFGRELRGPLDAAVMASCAIPGWYAPVPVGGRRYVDAGGISTTSLDMVAGLPLDELYVLAPMASFVPDRPVSLAARLERRYRAVVTRRLLREAAALRAAGTRVMMMAPGAEDLAAIGANLMDHRRRVPVLETSLRTSTRALRRVALAN